LLPRTAVLLSVVLTHSDLSQVSEVLPLPTGSI